MSSLRGRRVVFAELALLAVTLSVVYGFTRLFSDGSWIVPLTLAAVTTHGASALVRRQRLSVLLQIAVGGLAVLLLLGWTLAPDTLTYGLPSSETFTEFGEVLDDAAADYPEVRAPVPASDGFVLASMIGIAVIALMANIAAFTLRAPLQALVPPFTLFALGSLLGSGEHRVDSALAFVVASCAFALCMRGIDAATTTTWLPGDERRGPDALLRVGGVLLVVAAAATLVVGPALPGAADEALWTWRGGGGSGVREVVNPLIDIRARTVNQSREVAFVVRSAEPSYWRMMALDEFDGRIWRISTDFNPVSGSFAPAPVSDPAEIVEQEFEIRSLASEYLPAAYRAIAIDSPTRPVSWDDRSATLLLDDRADDGMRYSVRSVLPDHTPEQLRAADDAPPRAVTERYLQLPQLDPRVLELAQEVTAEAPTDYDKALALQTFFRENFEYSLEIPPGSSEEDIVAFLLDRRSGYCEQFAASFAALARSVGVPARVAVGFTEGRPSSADPEFFTVRFAQSHAWPEVYFTGVGWVPFEPTPGRAVPGGEDWTTLDATPEDEGSETTTPTLPEDGVIPTVPPTIFEDPGLLGGDSGAAPVADDTGPDVHPALLWAGAAVLLAAAWTTLITGLTALRRQRRRHRAAGDLAAATHARWTEAVEALSRRGHVPRDVETYIEYADRVGGRFPAVAPDLAQLAVLTTDARYAPARAADDRLDEVTGVSDRIVRLSRSRMPWWRRVLDLADPRALLPARIRHGQPRSAVLAASGVRY